MPVSQSPAETPPAPPSETPADPAQPVALVTGAGAGIGRAIAETFAAAARAETAGAQPLEHNDYKIALVQGLVRHALHEATSTPLPE